MMARRRHLTLQFRYNMLWITGGDPDGRFYAALRTGSVSNWNRWSDPKLDEMLDDQRATLDQAKRKAIVYDIQHRLLDTVASIWLYDWNTYVFALERVHGQEVVHRGAFAAWDQLGKVWMEKK